MAAELSLSQSGPVAHLGSKVELQFASIDHGRGSYRDDVIGAAAAKGRETRKSIRAQDAKVAGGDDRELASHPLPYGGRR
ncbi:MAG: hypothetical protein ACREOD_05035, partial [Candidatus Dormibacteria bacterium]